jgi:hypothetical protein
MKFFSKKRFGKYVNFVEYLINRLASLASIRQTAWQMSVNLVNSNIFCVFIILHLPDLLNLPNLPNGE